MSTDPESVTTTRGRIAAAGTDAGSGVDAGAPAGVDRRRTVAEGLDGEGPPAPGPAGPDGGCPE